MKKQRKRLYGVVALAAMALIFVGGVSAFGGGLGFGVNNPDLSDEEKAQMREFRTQLETAIENEDYEAWKTLMESQLTSENFQLLVDRHSEMAEVQEIREQMREARESGDTETFEELRTQMQELMPEKQGSMRFGKGFNKGSGSHECPFAE